MKQTINANIGGAVFTMDEDAYQRLKNYLDQIQNRYRNEEGADEILQDIEGRLAELFAERLSGSKTVVVLEDVEAVIKIMGDPEEFEETEEEPTEQTSEQSWSGSRGRLFRNPDDKILGGVSSGLAAYLDIDTVWVRLAFVIALLLFGSGVLLYIVLWLIIPEARSRSEKMEMKGERINISSIEKKVKSEFDNIRDRVRSGDAKTKARGFFHQVFDRLREFMHGFGRPFGIFLGIAITAVCLITIVALSLSLFGPTDWASYSHVNTMNMVIFKSDMQGWLFGGGLFLLIFIPLCFLIFQTIRALLYNKHKRSENKFSKMTRMTLRVVFMLIWTASLATCMVIGFNVGSDFIYKSSVKETHLLDDLRSDTVKIEYLKKPDRELILQDEPNCDLHAITVYDDHVDYNNINLHLIGSEDSTIEVFTIYSSRGRSRRLARISAEAIDYTFNVENNTILFDPTFQPGVSQRFRNQRIDIYVKIPEDKKVIIDERLSDEILEEFSHDLDLVYKLNS